MFTLDQRLLIKFVLIFSIVISILFLGSTDIIQQSYAGGGGGGGGLLPPCDKIWVGGEGNWEDPTKWLPSPPVSGFPEVICIDGGNIVNSVVHLNSDFIVPLDIIVSSGDKLVIESGWTMTHGELNLSYHNFGILQIFGSYEQFGSIFFNDGEVIVECDGSFEIFFDGILDGNPITIADCFIGGDFIGVDSTALMLAGAKSFSWMIPVILSGIGIGLFVFRKSENS